MRKGTIPKIIERDFLDGGISSYDLSPKEVFDTWLRYNGIIGYSELIWNIVIQLSGLQTEILQLKDALSRVERPQPRGSME